MMTIAPSVQIYVCLKPADMRKSIDGLATMAREEVKMDPLFGHLFLFRNQRGDRLKVLYWDRNGYCLLYKRLEKGRFSFPPAGTGRVQIDESAFQLLLGGLSLERLWNRVEKSP